MLTLIDGADVRRSARSATRIVALWRDATDGLLYVYTQSISTRTDLGHMLTGLVDDLGVSLVDIDDASPLIRGTPLEPDETGLWEPASPNAVRIVLGFESEVRDIDIEQVVCDPLCIKIVRAPAPVDPAHRRIRAPIDARQAPRAYESDLVERTILAACCGQGGGGCTGPCCGGCCPPPGTCIPAGCSNYAPNDCDGDGIPNSDDPDIDGDGILNGDDPDVDGDGIPNGDDPDVDGDGIPNQNDPDVDGDGIPNSDDPDIDGDGISNPNDDDIDGDGIPNPEDPSPGGCEGACCGSADPCCGSTDPCCGVNCDDDNPCTTDSCLNGTCLHDPLCSPSQECCPNGECCDDACEGCINNGQLTGGTATLDATPVCLGDPITWRIDQDVVDSGGIKRVFCTAKTAIDPVAPTYRWTITKPDTTTVSGSGKVAMIVTNMPGIYNCTFTAFVPAPPLPNSRECRPADHVVNTAPAVAFTIDAIQVDAADPHQAWVSYHIEPSTVLLDSAVFTAPGTAQQATNLQADFAFAFDQADVIGSGGTIQLQGTSGAATCVNNFGVAKTNVVAPQQSTLQEIAIFRITFEGGVLLIPVTHGIFGSFAFLCYAIDTTAESKTQWFGFGLVNIETEHSTVIPTVIAGWTERLTISDNSGTIASGTMTDVTGPTIPAQGPNYRSKDLGLDGWSVPNSGIVALSRIESIIFTDSLGSPDLYFPITLFSMNVEIDLLLEENGNVPTTCP